MTKNHFKFALMFEIPRTIVHMQQLTDDYAKDGSKELFTKVHYFEPEIFYESIGIRL